MKQMDLKMVRIWTKHNQSFRISCTATVRKMKQKGALCKTENY